MRNLKLIALSVLLFFILFLLGAFYSVSFDISKWTKDTRLLFCILGFFSMVILFLSDKSKEEN